MLEKVGHVKNPLTIIAIFAGLAEVFGTLILPLMDVSVQRIFVWFLMFFPIALVTGFFFLLWYKHEVLYAPSDFRSDDLFERIYRSRSPLDKIAQEENENKQEHVEEAKSGVDNDLSHEGVDVDRPQSSQADQQDNNISPTEEVANELNPEKPKKTGINHAEVVAVNYMAEAIGVEILSNMTGLKFDKNVSFGSSKYIYDAVSIGPERAVIAEFKYLDPSSNASVNSIVRRVVETLARAYEEIPPYLRPKFEGIGFILLDSSNLDVSKRIRRFFDYHRRKYDFSIPMKLHIFSMESMRGHEAIKCSKDS